MVIKDLLSPPSQRVIFDLFLPNRRPLIFKSRLINSISGKPIEVQDTYTEELEVPFQIMDVPDYLKYSLNDKAGSVSIKSLKQYNGYVLDLTNIQSTEDYTLQHLSKASRNKVSYKLRKLERLHDITYKFYWGKMDRGVFDTLFDKFYELLEKRFEEKKSDNRYLSQWKDIASLTYPKILNKTASLFVLFDGQKPINFGLNFHLGDILFAYIQTFDTDYGKYSMGDISMLKYIEWCLQNKISTFDLSMGATSYKLRWSNHQYTFHYLLLYSDQYWSHLLWVKVMSFKLKTKQYLRDRNIIGKYFSMDRIKYILGKLNFGLFGRKG
ncbi:GNAT family N-acetyltransferase [Robiginitalea sp. IMCC43444]|uniref:GNAT family N-acetyltransferase n=1 Tax=Robiginitalea sp. IMCC43444 TaxID=3459121 RepID=UPI004042CA67